MEPKRLKGLLSTFCAAGLVVILASSHSISNAMWQAYTLHRVNTREKVVALTYDDGPSQTFTPEILSTLNRYHVHATFFMVGRCMDRYPDLVRRVVADGNAIGNHTYTHPGDIEADSRAQTLDELERCEKTIERLSGKRTYLFRPPKGLVDRTVYSTAEQLGYRTILWTVCADNRNAPTPQMMADRVTRNIRPGAIVLMHDGNMASRWKDVQATSLVIESLKSKGYRFVTLPELLSMENKGRHRSSH